MFFKNRRTLKRRIRRTISFGIFITIVLFSIIMILMVEGMFRTQVEMVCRYFNYSIGEEMNSDYFLRQLGIKGLEEFDPYSEESKIWMDNLEKLYGNRSVSRFHIDLLDEYEDNSGESSLKLNVIRQEDEKNEFIFNLEDMVIIEININEDVIYSSMVIPKDSPVDEFFNELEKEFEESDAKDIFNGDFYRIRFDYPLFSSQKQPIGMVTTRVNKVFIIAGFILIVFAIIIISLIALFAAAIISRFLTLHISVPLKQLEGSVKAAASGDYEAVKQAIIKTNKPLREIESLAGHTNIIIDKMRKYNDMLELQKKELEHQNDELEAQNEELTNSRKQLQEAQTMLVQTENMASIGQLTAAILHEINTPLGAATSNVQICDVLLQAYIDNYEQLSTEEKSDMISQMKEANDMSILACKRILEIIMSLKNFTRLDQAEFQQTDLVENIKSVLVLTSNLWKRSIIIHEEYIDRPFAKCFPGLLNQVFMNIIVNAIQAINGKGDICIKTFIDGSKACISIKDNGPGISEENLPRIFDPGFSTKQSELGMGLGLSISSNIIKKHNGDIKVNTKLGEGTEFIVCIPL